MAEPWDTLRSLFPDNQTGEISASDMRSQVDLLEANDAENIKGASGQYIILNPDDSVDIADTVTAIVDASHSKRYLIELTAGEHTTKPVTMKPYIYIRGVNKDATVVHPSATTDTVFTMADFSMLTDMIVSGATSGKAVYMGVSGHTHLEDFGITNCNIGVHLDHADALMLCDINWNFTIGTGIYVTAGNLTLDKAVFFDTTTASNLVHCTGPNTVATLSHVESFGGGITTGFRIEGGARVVINNPSLANTGTGLYMTGDSNCVVKGGKAVLCGTAVNIPDVAGSPFVEAAGFSMQNNTIGANIGNPRCTAVGMLISDQTKDFLHPDATFHATAIDLAPGDEGLQVYGELKVGLPGRGSESCFGEGDSYSGENRVYFYSWDGISWSDITEPASSPFDSPFSFPNGNVNTALYMASRIPEGSSYQKHGGFKMSIIDTTEDAPDLLVTGVITPDGAGSYEFWQTLNGQPAYRRLDLTSWIAFVQGEWGIFDTEPTASTKKSTATHLSTALIGSYIANTGTGTATVAYPASSFPFIIEYYDGTVWQAINYMVTDAQHSYISYGKKLFSHRGAFHVRYNVLLDTDSEWVPSDPMGLGSNFFWTRIRIASGITTPPVLEQFKVHSNRTEINSDGYIEFFGKARPFNRLPWDAGLIEPAASSPASQDLYVSDVLARGYAENFFGNGDIVGFNTYLPNQVDTSTPIRFAFSIVSGSVHGDITWTVRYGYTSDGSNIYLSTAAAPTTGPNEQSVTVTAPIPVANSQYTVSVDLDISELVPAREGSFGDMLWVSIERTSGGVGTAVALINVQPLYAQYVLGGHI